MEVALLTKRDGLYPSVGFSKLADRFEGVTLFIQVLL